MARDRHDPGTGDIFAYADPPHVLQQRAALIVGRMKDGTATRTDLERYADACRALKRQGIEIPEDWPAPAVRSSKSGPEPGP